MVAPNIIRVCSQDELKNETLRERAMRAKSGRSTEFIAVSHDSEIALLSYEDWSHQSLGFIYEIFVLPIYRNSGVGALLLSYAEDLATQLGCSKIRLKPYPLDSDISVERLVSWYTKNGYVRDAHEIEIMEKSLARASA